MEHFFEPAKIDFMDGKKLDFDIDKFVKKMEIFDKAK